MTRFISKCNYDTFLGRVNVWGIFEKDANGVRFFVYCGSYRRAKELFNNEFPFQLSTNGLAFGWDPNIKHLTPLL